MVVSDITKLEFLAWRYVDTLPDKQVFELLFNEEDKVRETAGRVIQQRATDFLFEKVCALQHEPKAYLREICAFILGQIQFSRLEQQNKILEILVHLAQDKRIRVKATALQSFGYFYTWHEIPVTNEILNLTLANSKHPSASVRFAVTYSLSVMPDCPAVRQAIDELLDDENFDVRDWADFALEMLDEEREKRETS